MSRQIQNTLPFFLFYCLFVYGCALFKPEIDYSEHTSEELNDFGVVYENAGITEKAALLYEMAMEKNGKNYVAKTNLGNVFFRDNHLEKAARLYESALKDNPEYVPALNNFGNLRIKTGEFNTAEEILKKALLHSKSGEDKKTICHSLGELFKAGGDGANAEKWFEKAENTKIAVILEDVPFFRQTGNGCGSAALASVYQYYGVGQSPETISSRVYDEKSKGSLNLKMLLDAREQGLNAVLYSGSFEDVRASVDQGNPLIIMHSSGFSSYHYMVVGYEGKNVSTIIVHDGASAFARYESAKIRKSWEETGFCAISISKGGSGQGQNRKTSREAQQ